MNQFAYKTFYRRRLPHIQPEGATMFVTFRLAGSLPIEVVEELQKERKNAICLPDPISETGKQKPPAQLDFFHSFEKWDKYLDRITSGARYLSDDRIAHLVAESLQNRDNRIYRLHAFCIMPNHVHAVFTPLVEGQTYNSLAKIMHSLKRYTARGANKLLGREGDFWQHESYDHFIRHQDDFERIVSYILLNPVTAGLADEWQHWKWTFFEEK